MKFWRVSMPLKLKNTSYFQGSVEEEGGDEEEAARAVLATSMDCS